MHYPDAVLSGGFEVMSTVQVERDKEGYLLDPEDWDEDLARQLAAEYGLELGEDHWLVLRFMRAYLQQHGVAPDVRHVTAHLVKERGMDKKAAKALLFELFPYGYMQQGCKIAGFRRPRAWSTG